MVPAVMRLDEAKRFTKRLINAVRAPGLVLLYHRVMDLDLDPQQLCVSREHFAQQMALVSEEFEPLPLKDFVELSRRNRLPRRAVAVTFDDGYFDNGAHAAPILERYGVPATIFVTSGQVGSGAEFWWDELENIFLTGRALPDLASLALGEGIRGGGERAGTLARRIGYSPTGGDEERRRAIYRDLCTGFRRLNAADRTTALQTLRLWAGHDGEARPSHRAFSESELREVGVRPLISIGGHTQSHACLSHLSIEGQRTEIEGGKSELERILGRPVDSFAYPFGGAADYSMATAGVVQEAGFDCACANMFRWIGRIEDVWQIPRFLVRDWPRDEFRAQIDSLRRTSI